MSDPDFGGLTTVAFESRRAAEMAALVTRYGGVFVSAPALREVRSPMVPGADQIAPLFEKGAFDIVLFLTGVGTRALVAELAPVLSREKLVEALGRSLVVARGPKPAGVLRELGVRGFLSVPSPNTYRETLSALDAELGREGLASKRMFIQEYGVPNTALHEGLRERGVHMTSVQVYTWALPEDTSKLRSALGRIARGEARVALFTTRAQVENALVIAAEEGIEAEVRAALRSGVIGSVGPVCSEALRAEGLVPDIEPEHPKMGHLVKEVAEKCASILAAKDARKSSTADERAGGTGGASPPV